MRLIDKDRCKADIEQFNRPLCDGYHMKDYVLNQIITDIENQPTVDAVPVVMCKDCKWGREACGNIECHVDLNIPSEYHGYDWYCPNGERKEE